MKIIKISASIAAILFIALIYNNLRALSSGMVGLTKRAGGTDGCICHDFEPSSSVKVFITGPSSVRAGDTAVYTLKMTGGPLITGGCDISAGRGLTILSSSDTSLKRVEAAVGIFELTHKYPKGPVSDTVRWTFRYVAPNTPNTVDTIFSTGNSCNNNSSSSGDLWNFGTEKVITITSTSSIAEYTGNASSYKLEQNFPNPFNPSTIIKFSIPKSSIVSLKIFDISGREVETAVNEFLNAGEYSYRFNGNKLSAGVYFYKLSTDEFSQSKKLILSK